MASKRPKKQFESIIILELAYGAACALQGGRAPEDYARALRCNSAGPFQICFLRDWRVERKTEGQKREAEHSQHLASRVKQKDSDSEETARVKLLHNAILALGEGCNTLLMFASFSSSVLLICTSYTHLVK